MKTLDFMYFQTVDIVFFALIDVPKIRSIKNYVEKAQHVAKG